jgi:TRAP-type C4-dicarboxylate transport system permease small subunit
MLRVIINFLDRTLAWVGGLTLLVMMFLTFADVIGRYFFRRPVLGAFELTEILLAITVFAAMPAVTQQDKHIKLDFLDEVMGKGLRGLIDGISTFFMMASLFLLGYAVALQASKMAAAGLHSEFLNLPTFWALYLVSGLLVLSAIFLICRILFGIVSVVGGNVHYD